MSSYHLHVLINKLRAVEKNKLMGSRPDQYSYIKVARCRLAEMIQLWQSEVALHHHPLTLTHGKTLLAGSLYL